MSIDLETQLRGYRQNFDREAPAVAYEGRTRRPVVVRETKTPSQRRRRPRPGLVVAMAAALVVVVLVGGVVLISRPGAVSPDVAGAPGNGWIAFADDGIWLVALDQQPRRVIGTATDSVDEQCPAFAPDGRTLAYARVEDRSVALVVVDVDPGGRISDPVTMELAEDIPPPCPVWSPDGKRIAFGAARTSPINPTTGAAGSEVWIVTLAGGGTTILPNLLATDLEWSPDGSQLAVASGVEQVVRGNMLHDGRIFLYAPASGTMRSIDGTLGATSLTWSPDGRRIAYQGLVDGSGGDSNVEIRVIDLETGKQDLLDTFHAIHGIGPVWSPDGRWIAYQRCNRFGTSCNGEAHEVVLASGGGLGGAESAGEIVIHASLEGAGGSACDLLPRSVTWSPDGRYLLYSAWGRLRPNPQSLSVGPFCPGKTFLSAVPIDQSQPVVKLTDPDRRSEGGASSSRYDERSLVVPIQRWGVRASH